MTGYNYQTSSGWWSRGQVNWILVILAAILLCIEPNWDLSMIWMSNASGWVCDASLLLALPTKARISCLDSLIEYSGLRDFGPY